MCGRYYIEQEDETAEMRRILEELNRRYFGQEVGAKLRTGEIFPSQVVPVLRAEPEQTIRPVLMRWGLAKPFGSGDVINARAETAATKPFFKTAFLQGRILIPANAFFEWRARAAGDAKAKKQKVKITLPKQTTFYMAGLSRREEKSQGEGSFAILTTAASDFMRPLHDRQPLILPRTALRDWILDEDKALNFLRQVYDRPLQLSNLS